MYMTSNVAKDVVSYNYKLTVLY